MAVQEAVAEAWQARHRLPDRRRLWTDRDLAGGDLQSDSTSTAYTGTIGLPMPSTEITIRDDDGNDLPLGEAGEIVHQGPAGHGGYWQRPDETAKVMTADGFFKYRRHRRHGRRGYVKIVDRKKDMIMVSGFNVYPERDRGCGREPSRACWSAPRSACRTRSPARR